MASRNTTKAAKAAAEEEKMLTEEIPQEEPAEEMPEDATEETTEIDAKDAEIARLKAELAKANSRAAYRTPQEEQERLGELAEKAAEAGEDPWGIKVEIRVPRRGKTEDPWYWINIGGRSIQIPADDKVQEIKLPFALILMDMIAAENMTQGFIDKKVQVYDPITNPHPAK